MIGYLYLAVALFAGLTKGFCGKKTSSDMSTFKDCLFINLARMFFCAIIGFLLILVEWNFSSLTLTAQSFPIYLLSALGMSTFCVLWMYAYKQDAYVFLNIFTMLGSIVTCLLSLIVFGDPIKWNQWIGIAILFCAVTVMSKYNKEIKGKLSIKGILILIFGCIGCAVSDFSQKLYVKTIGESVATFNFYTYAFGFVIILILHIITCTKQKSFAVTPAVSSKRNIWTYFIMSFFLFLNTVFKTLAATLLTTAQIYPVLQGSNLICSGLMAHIMFKEKANTKSVIGMTIAFIGLLIMNLL